MYARGLTFAKALKIAKSKRSAIDPIGSFPVLLKNLEKALSKPKIVNEIKETCNPEEDI